jgi:hypothetical protein
MYKKYLKYADNEGKIYLATSNHVMVRYSRRIPASLVIFAGEVLCRPDRLQRVGRGVYRIIPRQAEDEQASEVRVQTGTGKLICPRHGLVDGEYKAQAPSPCGDDDEAWVWEDGKLIAVPNRDWIFDMIK